MPKYCQKFVSGSTRWLPSEIRLYTILVRTVFHQVLQFLWNKSFYNCLGLLMPTPVLELIHSSPHLLTLLDWSSNRREALINNSLSFHRMVPFVPRTILVVYFGCFCFGSTSSRSCQEQSTCFAFLSDIFLHSHNLHAQAHEVHDGITSMSIPIANAARL